MSQVLKIFQGYGIELEYMLVDRDSLKVQPVADKILTSLGGELSNEVERGVSAWSNELVLHVLELKNPQPVRSLAELKAPFRSELKTVHQLLEAHDAILLPTAMHPFMNPERDTKLWPHELKNIYATYDRVFGCRGHGWSNLQSTHLNLSFSNDDEFSRLHRTLRVLMPLMPALSASSPVVEGRRGPWLSNRMWHYLQNQRRIPSILGQAVPEPIWSVKEYKKTVLESMYRDVAPFDPEGELQHEWLNSRGVIPKFSRHSFEVRVLDIQECPEADFAITDFLISVLKKFSDQPEFLKKAGEISTESLRSLLDKASQFGPQHPVEDAEYIRLWRDGPLLGSISFAELCGELMSSLSVEQSTKRWFELFLRQGCLSERILRRLTPDFSLDEVNEVYRELADHLRLGTYFEN